MENKIHTELSILSEAKKILDRYGEANILYITAEFQPFSNQRKPDLQFSTNENDDKMYFIEYKFMPRKGFDELYFKSIVEHKNFVEEDIEVELKYVYVSDQYIDVKFLNYLKSNNIVAYGNITNSNKLVNLILEDLIKNVKL